ncbi:hypothetical protein BESB_011790 [Besnoitia besnoiti]|uniref:VTC domain-containing protein n=1 Tax=Besnoitia besnoiti TaxID=94643 RepID=A0A2A9MAC8_BESBE|nr:hypothetical protein BESB_011790 [Besnoitia besnoiti]PFH32567.1 hypothetical protein BESB_011790 [Besnoitia besnoiti]
MSPASANLAPTAFGAVGASAEPRGVRLRQHEKRDSSGFFSTGAESYLATPQPAFSDSPEPRHYKPLYVDVPRIENVIRKLAADARQKLSAATIKKQLKQLQHEEPLPLATLLESAAAPREEKSSADDGRDGAKKAATAGASVHGQAEMLGLLPESRFRNVMQQQVQRLNFFAETKAEEIRQQLCHIYNAIGLMREQHGFTPDVAARLEDELDAQAAEITHLDFFVRKNYKSLVELGRLFDQLLGTDTTRWFLFSLIKEKFCNVDLEGLMLRLSLAWSAFRQAKAGVTESGKWQAPETFVRNTTKYWLRSDRVVHAQCLILKHLPFLVYGASEEELAEALLRKKTEPPEEKTSSDKAGRGEAAEMKKAVALPASISASQPITSVYVDSNSGYSYSNRILRLEGAQLIRFRWYGANDNESDKIVFIERKTHHESWTGLSSTKERFAIDQKYVKRFLLGRLPAGEALALQFRDRWRRKKLKEKAKSREPPPPAQAAPRGPGEQTPEAREETAEANKARVAAEEAEAEKKYFEDPKTQKSLELACEIQDAILAHGLLPMVRTSYLRAAFQLSSSNAVRISLDTNLCMVDELTPQYVMLAEEEARLKRAAPATSPAPADALSFWERLREPAGLQRPAPRREVPALQAEQTRPLEGGGRLDRMRADDDDDVLWCRVAEELLGKNDVVRFPFAVLEVKLQTSPSPPWVEELLALCDATMVPKFSKFQHGMAFLHSDKVNRLPYWLCSTPEPAPQVASRTLDGDATRPTLASQAPADGTCADRRDEAALAQCFRFGSRRGASFFSPLVRSVDDSGFHAEEAPVGRGAAPGGGRNGRGDPSGVGARRKPSRAPALSCDSDQEDDRGQCDLVHLSRRLAPHRFSARGTDAARTLDWLRQRHDDALVEDLRSAAERREALSRKLEEEAAAGRDEAARWRVRRGEGDESLDERLALVADDEDEDEAVEGDEESEEAREGGGVSARQRKSACLRKVLRQSRKMKKIDPKSFFANERTFLHYVQKGVYLAALAIALLQWGGGVWAAELAGFGLAFAVLSLLAYSYHIFEARGRKLEKKVARGDLNSGDRYDSRHGPVLVFASVSLVVFFILALQVDSGVKKLRSI